MVSSVSLFQLSIILFEKKYFLISQWTFGLISFNLCPLVRLLFIVKKSEKLRAEISWKILKTSMRSKYNLRSWSGSNSRMRNLSRYEPLNPEIFAVNDLWTLSIKLMSFFNQGDQITVPYSTFGRTKVTNIQSFRKLRSLVVKFRKIHALTFRASATTFWQWKEGFRLLVI